MCYVTTCFLKIIANLIPFNFMHKELDWMQPSFPISSELPPLGTAFK